MNLPVGWQEAYILPLIILIVILLGVVVILGLIVPALSKPKRVSKLRQTLSLIKKYPITLTLLTLIIVAVLGGGYLFYYFNQPVRIVSAAQFKLEKGKAVRQLQQGGLVATAKAGIYFLDVRSRDDYAAGHVVASASIPAAIAAGEEYPIERVDIVVYSSESRLEEARKVADAIKRNGDSVKKAYKGKIGKIYVIRDGFEGLKKAGLATEAGIWD